MGCDVRRSRNFYGVSHFYSHIPCGMWHGLFYLHFCIVVNFYSHIPCGMWRKAALELYYDKTISTHTSRVGCDTVEQWHQYITGGISTHTSRVGCDYFSNHPSDRFFLYFYSHIPCGMWHFSSSLPTPSWEFLLTHPVWDVTIFFAAFIHQHI